MGISVNREPISVQGWSGSIWSIVVWRHHLTSTMKVAYPHSHDPDKLESPLLSLKIARHSPCSICWNCLGLHPPPKVDVVLDGHSDSSLGDLGQYGSDDDDEEVSSYFETCACGHNVKAHNADELELGRSEFARRGRVACRLDELLQVSWFMWTSKDCWKLQVYIFINKRCSKLNL